MFSDAHVNVSPPQLRSYSRHDLLIDPLEDNVSEVHFRKQRVEMERRVSLFVNVAAVEAEDHLHF